MSKEVGTNISGKWVVQTLRDRGIPVADAKAVEQGFRGLRGDELTTVLDIMRRIAAGTETLEMVDQVRDLLSSRIPVAERIERADAGDPLPNTEGSPATGRKNKRVAASPGAAMSERTSWKKLHIYAKSAALTVEIVQPMRVAKGAGPEWFGMWTVQFELAKADPIDAGYEWDKKISVQLSPKELVKTARGLLSLHDPKLEFHHHGADRSKSLRIAKLQDGTLGVQASRPRTSITVPVDAEDRFMMTTLVMAAVQDNAPGLGSNLLAQMLGSVGVTH